MKKNFLFSLILFISFLLSTDNVFGATFNVTNETELSNAITTSNSNGEDDIINITNSGTITLTGDLPQIISDGGYEIEINNTSGGTVTISGGYTRRIFFVNGGDLTINGLRIVNGYAGVPAGSIGGGIRALNCSLTINNCEIKYNTAINHGGGIYMSDGSLNIVNSEISSNVTAVYHGGGINIFQNSTVTITGSLIDNNTTNRNGGGIYLYNNSTLTVANSTINSNEADYGAGIISGSSCTTSIENSEVNGNDASQVGGGIMAGNCSLTISNSKLNNNNSGIVGGALYTSDLYSFSIDNCEIKYNTSAHGAGLIVYRSSVPIQNSEITGNYAVSTCGGVYAHNDGIIYLTNVYLGDNHAGISGDNFYEVTSGQIILTSGSYLGIENSDWTVDQFHDLSPGIGAYIYTNKSGRLLGITASSVTYTVGTPNLGLCPLVITAPASNTFGVNLKDYSDEPHCLNFPSLCYWDIIHTGGSDPADIDLIYQKANVPSGYPDLTALSFALHYNGSQWENLTPGGATTVDNWNGDTGFFMTSVANVSEFSPFAPSAFASIPTLTEWAAIALGSLLALFGGWFVWRRVI